MQQAKLTKENKPFIPAAENKIHINFFDAFTRFLLWRNFDSVHTQFDHVPQSGESTLFIGNHNSWWDALTPLYVNQKYFHQRPRAVMEWEQVKRYGFFKKIGCFSIDRSDPRSALKSLQYGIDWLNNESGNSLYLYPQGKIENPWLPQQPFETGIGWMIPKLKEHVKVVPFIQHQHSMHTSKPVLFLKTGKPIELDDTITSKKEITKFVEYIVLSELLELIQSSSLKK